MTLLVVAGIVAGVLWGLAVLVKYLTADGDAEEKAAGVRVASWLRRAAVTLPAIFILLDSLTVVPAGHVGIQVLFGRVYDAALSEGVHAVNPLVAVEDLSVRVQKSEGDYTAASQDMQNVHVKMAINYRLLANKASDIYRRVGLDYVPVIMDPAAQEVLKAVTANHVASEILRERPAIKSVVQRGITEWVAKYGIDVREVSITNIGFDKEYAAAIERKQIQEQVAEQKKYELTKAQREAEIAAATAKGKADAVREEAAGNADALRVKGQAEADYNKRVADSLRQQPDLIRVRWIERWDGTLPATILGDQAQVLMQMGAR